MRVADCERMPEQQQAVSRTAGRPLDREPREDDHRVERRGRRMSSRKKRGPKLVGGDERNRLAGGSDNQKLRRSGRFLRGYGWRGSLDDGPAASTCADTNRTGGVSITAATIGIVTSGFFLTATFFRGGGLCRRRMQHRTRRLAMSVGTNTSGLWQRPQDERRDQCQRDESRAMSV